VELSASANEVDRISYPKVLGDSGKTRVYSPQTQSLHHSRRKQMNVNPADTDPEPSLFVMIGQVNLQLQGWHGVFLVARSMVRVVLLDRPS
jgi:hypothetical protein